MQGTTIVYEPQADLLSKLQLRPGLMLKSVNSGLN